MSVLALSGSVRRGSVNMLLLKEAARAAEEAGLIVDICSGNDLDLPIFSQDIEAAGLPDSVRCLREKAAGASAFIMACPEYNHSLTPLLKNALDWLSRPRGEESYGALFRQKPVLILSATPGPAGGAHARRHLRDVLEIFTMPCSGEFGLGRAYDAVTAEGTLHLNSDRRRDLHGAVRSFANACKEQLL
ncbi:MAG: NADPH-dependent FMN reductase [Fibrobacterota bacterium]